MSIETTPPLWPHQVEAIERYQGQLVAFLYHRMGLGKTRTTIELMKRWGAHRGIIVCPKAVIATWRGEIGKYWPEMHPYVLSLTKGTANDKATLLKTHLASSHPVIAVVNFGSVWRGPLGHLIKKTVWDLAVADEAHQLKSAGTTVSRFYSTVGRHSARRIALTGTAMAEGPQDLYGQLRFLDPAILGVNHAEFKAKYFRWGGYENHQIIGMMNSGDLMEKFWSVAHYVPEDAVDLPELVEYERTCSLDASALKIYRELRDELITELQSGTVTAANGGVRLLRLQQIAGGFLSGETVFSGKLELLREILDGLDEPVVVFARFSKEIEAIREVGAVAGFKTMELSGQRDDLQKFKTSDFHKRLIVVQIQSGGAGIDLTKSRVGIYYSVGVSATDYEQSRKRLHRPGQTHGVRLITLITKGTVDRRVYKLLAEKKDLVAHMHELLNTNEDPED